MNDNFDKEIQESVEEQAFLDEVAEVAETRIAAFKEFFDVAYKAEYERRTHVRMRTTLRLEWTPTTLKRSLRTRPVKLLRTRREIPPAISWQIQLWI